QQLGENLVQNVKVREVLNKEMTGLAKKGKSRSQRITFEDQEKILQQAKWDKNNSPRFVKHYVCWAML
ncbi:hypothetical protein RFX69_08650, partial [Acinetobacter sp. 148]|nr:hypothetical protein [Acinetobacter sp. 148]